MKSNGFPSVRRNIIWIEDLDAYRRSWNAMIATSVHTIYPSHGKPFPAGDLVKYCRDLDRINIY